MATTDPKPMIRGTKGCKRMSTGQIKRMNQVLEKATFRVKMWFFHSVASCIKNKLEKPQKFSCRNPFL